MGMDGTRVGGRRRLPGWSSLFAACTLVALGATACGGSKEAAQQTDAGTGLFLKGTPDERAALIKARLTAAGYVVHPVPRTLNQTGLDAAPGRVLRPETSLTALDRSLNAEWTRLHREIAAITARTHRAAEANQGLSQQTFDRLIVIAKQVKALSLKERTILLFDSPTEAGLYTQRLDQQNRHRREVLSESVVAPGDVQITKYRADGPTIFVAKADTSSDASGTILEDFDKPAFRKFVAIAEGQA